MKASAIVVTRGDVNLNEVVKSLRLCERIGDIIIWDNAKRGDSAVYGRYAAIAEAKHPLIFVQDDDCILPPESIEEIIWTSDSGSAQYGQLVCNMPQQFRHEFYAEHSLVGFGACFHRDLPFTAFDRFHAERPDGKGVESMHFLRTCDIVFTALTPHAIVDVPYKNLWWAEDESRMYRHPEHFAERKRMLEFALQVRDG